MRIRRYFSCILSICMAVGILSACGNSSVTINTEDKIRVVSTIFPQYDWMRRIVGENIENVELTLLLDNGADIHNYQPTTDDIIQVSECDILIYVGGESDSWVEDILLTAVNQQMEVINLLEVLGDKVKEEERKEGMQQESGVEHAGGEYSDADNGGVEHGSGEYDEHVWLSLGNAKIICTYLAERLSRIDEENADSYQANLESYLKELTELDRKYQDVAENGVCKTLLFGDRFPFRYLVDDYGLDYYAAFAGCSAETEASFETIIFLADKMDELALKNILVIEGSDQSIARTVVSSTEDKGQRIAVLDSMQSISEKQVKEGITYLSIMEKNLEVLREVLY